jgi:ParB-like chromosome segregation protein Spo0J
MRARPIETHIQVSNIALDAAPVGTPQVQRVLLTTLKASRRNVRTHSKKQIRQIANSIKAFGWSCPIVVDEDGTIIAGHGRFEAAKLLDYRNVPVIVSIGVQN